MKKQDLKWFLIGFGAAFILLNLIVSFYVLKTIVPSQINAAAGCAETACLSVSCYEKLNISMSEYNAIQNSCRSETENALALAIDPEHELFFKLVTQNFNWMLVIGIGFLAGAYILFRGGKKRARSVYI